MKIEQAVGANIRKFREERKMSQAALGEALGPLLGRQWERQAVSAAEGGKRSFTAAELYALGLALKVRPEWLLTLPAGVDAVELGAETPAPRLDESIPPGESLPVASLLHRLRRNAREQGDNYVAHANALRDQMHQMQELEALIAKLEHAVSAKGQEEARELPPGAKLSPWGFVTPAESSSDDADQEEDQ